MQGTPANMRYAMRVSRRIKVRNRYNSTRNQPQTGMIAELFAHIKQHLSPHTNTQKRPFCQCKPLDQIIKAPRLQLKHAIGKGPHTR